MTCKTWIEHVKDYAKKNNVSYKVALSKAGTTWDTKVVCKTKKGKKPKPKSKQKKDPYDTDFVPYKPKSKAKPKSKQKKDPYDTDFVPYKPKPKTRAKPKAKTRAKPKAKSKAKAKTMSLIANLNEDAYLEAEKQNIDEERKRLAKRRKEIERNIRQLKALQKKKQD